jgi:hypothetical protein
VKNHVVRRRQLYFWLSQKMHLVATDLMMRSLRSTGAHLESGLVREDMLSGTIRTRCDTGDTLMSANAKESKL